MNANKLQERQLQVNLDLGFGLLLTILNFLLYSFTDGFFLNKGSLMRPFISTVLKIAWEKIVRRNFVLGVILIKFQHLTF